MPISLSGSLNLSGSLTTTGTITATTLVVQTITSSISSITGSTNFGSLAANTHTFTGSILITGSNYISVGTPSPIYNTTLMSAYGSGSDVDIDVKNNTSAGAANIYLRSQTDGSGEIRFSRNSDNSIQGRIQFSQANGSMNFRTGGNDNKLFISSSGNVGIGTSTPIDLLTLYRNGNVENNISIYNGTAGYGTHLRLLAADNAGAGYNTISSYTNGGTTHWTIGSGATTSTMVFYTNNDVERMRITSAGNVGIGTNSPNVIAAGGPCLDLRGPTWSFIELGTSSTVSGSNDIGYLEFMNGNNTRLATIVGATDGTALAGAMRFSTANSSGGFTERMRITSGGSVCIGLTSSGTNVFAVSYNAIVSSLYVTNAGSVGSYTFGTGTVYANAGLLTMTNPSDSRLKDNINNISWGLSDILKLRPVSYHWKDDKANQGKQFGFVAQEVQEVMPEAIKEFGEDTKYLGLEKDAIYATLVKAIQELTARVQYLENK